MIPIIQKINIYVKNVIVGRLAQTSFIWVEVFNYLKSIINNYFTCSTGLKIVQNVNRIGHIYI